MFEKIFHLKENETNIKTEVIAGFSTFMTMSYILVVNPQILSNVPGMSFESVFYATVFAGFVGTLCMSLIANYPFALAPGMGLNAFFAFSIVLTGKLSMQGALTAIFIEGIVFILMSFFNVREMLMNAIPIEIKHAVTVGIGMFIAFIGFKGAGIVVSNPSTYISLTSAITSPPVLLAFFGIFVISVLQIKKVKGSILFGILAVWGATILLEVLGVYTPDMQTTFSAIPSISLGSGIHDMNLFAFDFSQVKHIEFWMIVFSFLFVDLFDTLATLIGVSAQAGMLDEEGKLPRAKQALLSDAIATTVGACLGTSTTTTVSESAVGIAEGGRTGLTSLIVALLFLVTLPFSTFFSAIPGFATAPALIFVGILMFSAVQKLDLSDYRKTIPSVLTIMAMPFTYSIAEGISFGIISYTLIHLLTGKGKDVNVIMYIITVLFILKYIFL